MSRATATGVLIVRVWGEPGAANPVRIRITRVDDLDREGGGGAAVSRAVASIDEVIDAVRQFVDRFDLATRENGATTR
jgi:hypothetical protein